MNLMVTERQEEILNSVVQEYINSAKPVSSQLLERQRDFGVSAATIRNEMQELTELGFLFQPHTSAGRVPTDKGYRFFVDELLTSEFRGLDEDFEMGEDTRSIAKFLASESSNLVLGYFANEKTLWQEGWKEVLREPEFTQVGLAVKLAQMIDDFEKNIESLFSPEIKVYIGRENPFSKARDFSIITTGTFTILGPKRMRYDKNINLLESLTKWLKKI